MLRRILSAAFTLCLAVLLLLYPTQALEAAREGIRLCLELIIPSLFPFFVLSSLFVSLGLAALLGRLCGPLLRPLFRLGGNSASPLILGLTGGYPVGIRTASELYASGQCSQGEFVRLACFCNNCGPAFLFTVAGVGIFGSRQAGFLLLGSHWIAALLLAFFSRPLSRRQPSPRDTMPTAAPASFSTAFPESVKSAFSSTLNVCAFVILFSVLIRLAQSSGVLTAAANILAQLLPDAATPALCQSLLIGLFELSTGVYSLAESSLSPLALPLAAFILGWGGLSVHCQSLPYLNSCPAALKPYFLSKLAHGLLSALLTALFLPQLSLPTAGIALETGLWALPKINLLRWEILALWLLSGIFCFLSQKKDWKKRRL